MVRLQVQLTEAQVRELKSMAAEQGVSVAELIRRGVDRQLRAETSDSRLDHVARLKRRVMHLDAGVKDLAREHDRYLAEVSGQDGDVR